jgi:hypothetical protein
MTNEYMNNHLLAESAQSIFVSLEGLGWRGSGLLEFTTGL